MSQFRYVTVAHIMEGRGRMVHNPCSHPHIRGPVAIIHPIYTYSVHAV